MYRHLLCLSLACVASLPQAVEAAPPLVAQARRDIVAVAAADSSFQTLVQLLTRLGMAEDFKGYGPFTLFAPTDAAFAAVPADIRAVLDADSGLMAKVLAYHAVAGQALRASAFEEPRTLRTLERSELRVQRRDGAVYAGDARVVRADLSASNGVIHAIDRVLVPPDVLAEVRKRLQSGGSTP
jgi:uncharacterized surface protein with fasciclin (FAS1) repeats